MPRVLLVDDDEMVRDIGVLLLGALGHSVVSADCGRDAWQILNSGQPFDVLMTDVMMPGSMNGIDLARASAEKFPYLKIIVVSGNLDQPLIDGKGQSLPFVLLQKPYRRSQLAEVLGTSLP